MSESEYDQGGPLDEPPEGVTPQFGGPNPNGVALWVVSVFLFVISTLFVAARIYTRAFLVRNLGWDDYTCVAAWVAGIVYTVTVTLMVTELDTGKHVWNVMIDNYRTRYAEETKIRFALQFDYLWLILLVKLSILLMYLRLFNTTRWFRLITYATMFVLVGIHFSCIVLYLCQNRPLKDFFDLEREELTEWVNMDTPVIVLAVVTIVTDVVMLILPVPITWRLNMRKRQKVVVTGILLAGVIVTLASVWRLVVLIQLIYDKIDDFTYIEYRFFLASSFEVNLAIICASAPVLQAFFKKFAPRVLRLGTSQPSYGPEGSQDRSRPRRDSRATGSKLKPKWPAESQSQSEELNNLSYVELSERGKSDEYSKSNSPPLAEP